MQENWFKDWFNTSYYHSLYKNRDDHEAAEFINRLVDYLSPNQDAMMLDLACGKGRHAVQLAQKGFHVVGVDLSDNSISQAKQFESERLEFYVQDMRAPCRINYFDYVFNFFTSFGYFRSNRDNINVIQSVHQSLKKQGYFVLDYVNVQYAKSVEVPEEIKLIDGVEYHIRKWHDEMFFHKQIIINDPALPEPIQVEEAVRNFSMQALTEMLENNGFEVKASFGDYHLQPFVENQSKRSILVAQKL